MFRGYDGTTLRSSSSALRYEDLLSENDCKDVRRMEGYINYKLYKIIGMEEQALGVKCRVEE